MTGPSDNSSEADPGVTDVDSAAAAFRTMMRDEDETPAEPGEPGEEPELVLDSEGEQEDKPSEPETAIDAPVSLNAAEKKAFEQLPSEAQRLIADVETRRNAQVQDVTTKASEAQRTADARAAAADATARQSYATQLDQFVAAFEPQMPDPQLAYSNPGQYVAEKAQFDALKAQHDSLVQQVRGVKTEADTANTVAFQQERDRALMTHPQIANPETRDTYVKGIMDLAGEVGLDPATIANNATGPEFLALAKIADRLTTAEAKAAKYDAAMAKQMTAVRQGKQRTMRPNAGQSEGTGQGRAYTDATTRLRDSGNIKDAAAAFRAIL